MFNYHHHHHHHNHHTINSIFVRTVGDTIHWRREGSVDRKPQTLLVSVISPEFFLFSCIIYSSSQWHLAYHIVIYFMIFFLT